MAKIETTNDTIVPMDSIIISGPVNARPNFNNFNKLAPNMTGIAKKNVNSAATNLEVPTNMAPTMVAPDLEVPGINDNT